MSTGHWIAKIETNSSRISVAVCCLGVLHSPRGLVVAVALAPTFGANSILITYTERQSKTDGAVPCREGLLKAKQQFRGQLWKAEKPPRAGTRPSSCTPYCSSTPTAPSLLVAVESSLLIPAEHSRLPILKQCERCLGQSFTHILVHSGQSHQVLCSTHGVIVAVLYAGVFGWHEESRVNHICLSAVERRAVDSEYMALLCIFTGF